jgi:hypothetical protein
MSLKSDGLGGAFDNTITGEMSLTATAAVVAADVPCRMVSVQAHPSNVGNVTLLGGNSETAGPILAAGEWSPPLPMDNLSQLRAKSSEASGDKLLYIGQKP